MSDTTLGEYLLVQLTYGTSCLTLDIEGVDATILRPRYLPGLSDEAASFERAVEDPIGSSPLSSLIRPSDRIAVVIPDITRALPSDRMLPWLFKALGHVPPERFTIIIGTGTHRENTPAEIKRMVGEEVASCYRVVNHRAKDPNSLKYAGESLCGYAVSFNKEYVEADKRIVLGFIEPHFMAGFSGGYKAVFPGLTNIDAIMKYHSAANIGHPGSTWGNLDNNPTLENIRAGASLLPIAFCINVALNRKGEITRFFCGNTSAAHAEGCRFVKDTAMVACSRAFPIVVTTNGGYPLDQNLYQAVKGISAAAHILSEGGLILIAARCNDGFPEHGNFKRFLFEQPDPRTMLDTIHAPGFHLMDQWQVQLLAQILLKGRVGVFSEIADEEILRAHLTPVHDIAEAMRMELARIGADAPVAILPEGPQTIPYC